MTSSAVAAQAHGDSPEVELCAERQRRNPVSTARRGSRRSQRKATGGVRRYCPRDREWSEVAAGPGVLSVSRSRVTSSLPVIMNRAPETGLRLTSPGIGAIAEFFAAGAMHVFFWTTFGFAVAERIAIADPISAREAVPRLLPPG